MSFISRENIAENSDYVANRHIHPAEADTDQCGDKRQQYHEENGKRCKMPPFDQKLSFISTEAFPPFPHL